MKRAILMLGLFFFFGGLAFARFGDTTLTFFDGTTTGKTLNMDFVVGTVSGFDVLIDNPTAQTQSLRLDFVSQVHTVDGNISCDMISGRQYDSTFLWTGSAFDVYPNSVHKESVQFAFSSCTSGFFHACAVQLPDTGTSIGSFDVFLGKVNFINLHISPNSDCFSYPIFARPAFRDILQGYSMTGADVRFLTWTGGSWVSQYNSSQTDAPINFDAQGRGDLYMVPPQSGTQYMIVLKPKGGLSVGYTGIWGSSVKSFNFFTGMVSDGLSDLHTFHYLSGASSEHYLRIGDLFEATPYSYDIINDSDFAEINNNLTIGVSLSPKFWYDFDINGVISALEQSMLLQSYGKYGYISWLDAQGIVPINVFKTF